MSICTSCSLDLKLVALQQHDQYRLFLSKTFKSTGINHRRYIICLNEFQDRMGQHSWKNEASVIEEEDEETQIFSFKRYLNFSMWHNKSWGERQEPSVSWGTRYDLENLFHNNWLAIIKAVRMSNQHFLICKLPVDWFFRTAVVLHSLVSPLCLPMKGITPFLKSFSPYALLVQNLSQSKNVSFLGCTSNNQLSFSIVSHFGFNSLWK